MLQQAQLVAFVPSTDLERSRSFYVDVLGLALQDSSPFALALRAGQTLLRVTKVDAFTPHPFTVLGWAVPDAAATVTELRSRGVVLLRYQGFDQDEHDLWTAPSGALVGWFADPDGNVLSLTQF